MSTATPVIICKRCGVIFDPYRPMHRDWMDAKRCKKCGKKHSPVSIQQAPSEKEPREDQELYFMQCGESVKIGVSVSPQQRKKQLQVGNNEQIELLKTWNPTDALKAERMIHKKLLDQHERGEWFDVDETDVNGLINAISAFVEGMEKDC